MGKELNIAAILKDKPQNTRLWSPIFGDVYLKDITDVNNNMIRITHHGVDNIFMNNGKVWADGDVCLFPSRWMHDWQKFAWKKGDVLVNSRGLKILFDRWADDNYYTSFYAKTINLVEDAFLDTNLHTLASEKEAKSFIKCIEEKFGGKINLETLEIEKQHKFKDGDILYVKTKLGSEYIMINKLSEEVKTAFYVACNLSSKKIYWNQIHSVCRDEEIGILRQVTDYEKSQLFEALAKKGKVWDSEKKQIVDLKPKWITPKPFDRVITRNAYDNIWTANIFSHMDSYGNYVTIGCVGSYPYCLPYNEETAHLLGTTDEWKGGE